MRSMVEGVFVVIASGSEAIQSRSENSGLLRNESGASAARHPAGAAAAFGFRSSATGASARSATAAMIHQARS
jgi:hypothetical protein